MGLFSAYMPHHKQKIFRILQKFFEFRKQNIIFEFLNSQLSINFKTYFFFLFFLMCVCFTYAQTGTFHVVASVLKAYNGMHICKFVYNVLTN